MLKAAVVAMALGAITWGAAAGAYQYAVPGKTADGKDLTAYLWVPPQADRIRGVLVGGMATSVEPVLCDDPVIRKACADEKLAIVYFAPHIDPLFGRDKGNPQEQLQQALNDLAELSGYREIAVAPLFPFGHSISTVYASRLATLMPDRCFGVLLHKGGIAVPTGQQAGALAGVPILAIKGQFEEFGPGPNGVLRDFEDRQAAWKTMRDTLLRLRAADPRHLLSLWVEPGATHFAWADYEAPVVAMFIRACAQNRIPDWPADAREPVQCLAIDPAKGQTQKAPGDDAQGDLWHLNGELARAIEASHAQMNRKPQFVTFADPATKKPILPGHDLRLKLTPRWTGPDTFKAAAVFLDSPPAKYPPVEGQVGHADGPVEINIYGGQLERVSADEFRVKLDPRRRMEGNLLAVHRGDATYRYAEQAAIVSIPRKLTAGKPQTIAFPPAGPLRLGGGAVKLAATSDSGLPVRYYVESGPAQIDGDELKVVDVPAKAKFPMKITLVAYQYGSAVEPLVQSAEPVRQEIVLER